MYWTPEQRWLWKAMSTLNDLSFSSCFGLKWQKNCDRPGPSSPSLLGQRPDPCWPRLPPADWPGPSPGQSLLVVGKEGNVFWMLEHLNEDQTCFGLTPSSAPGQRPYLAGGQVTTRSHRSAQNLSMAVQGHLSHLLSRAQPPASDSLSSGMCASTSHLPGHFCQRSSHYWATAAQIASPLRQWSHLPLPSTTKHPNPILTDTWLLGMIF